MAVFTSKLAGGIGKAAGVPQRTPCGVDLLMFDVEIPTTALDSNDEQVLLYKFPDDGDCFLLRGEVGDFIVDFDDMDSATSLVVTIGVGDSDGVVDTSLIAGSTAGQTGAVDLLDSGGAIPLDVTGKYLIFDVTAAAGTEVSGGIQVYAKVVFGKKLEADASLL
jgi:hypothetical protein